MIHIDFRVIAITAAIMLACYAMYLGIVLGFMALMGWC